ncbi:cytochrome P450 monooxygenase-like protein [Acrodontium crateriforme]|uniref:Cytochrome P450 monooxygenase-like protein n=1 Tax=Acrodontium crateriforme TaxID=150365 RepID=A0AAQ3RAZ8_9PEZI|nr:cytochrome P450 monooxygenase-like protein [Acrodontium crateriforme]
MVTWFAWRRTNYHSTPRQLPGTSSIMSSTGDLKSDDFVRSEIQSVATVQDPDIHRHLRYHLSHAFSLRELQAIANSEDGINVVEAYNRVAFDVMGEFAFSKNLGALDGDAFTLDWIASVLDGTLWGVVPMLLKRVLVSKFVFTRYLARTRPPKDPRTRIAEHDIRDILDAMLTDSQITEDRTVSQCMLVLAAGSGNIQSTLSSATFYLLSNPETLRKLQPEIRSCFKRSSDINDARASQLPYLHGVIEEALRLFPPIPSQLPRTSLGTMIDDTCVPKGTTVASATYSMSRDPRYWIDPDGFHPE